jgi:hypothetical protein
MTCLSTTVGGHSRRGDSPPDVHICCQFTKENARGRRRGASVTECLPSAKDSGLTNARAVAGSSTKT